MTRLLKIVGVTAASLVGLLLLAAIALLFVSDEQYKKLLQKGVHTATGRELAIDGEFDIGIGAHLYFNAKQVRFANPEWGSRPDMFVTQQIQGDLALLPLLRGVLDVSLIVDNPDLLLETNAHGRGNWIMGEPKTEDEDGEGAGISIKPLIRELSIQHGQAVYRDGVAIEGETKQPLQVTIDTLRLSQQSGEDGRVTTSHPLALEFAGAYNDLPLLLNSTLQSVEQLATNLPAEFQADLEAGDAKLAVSGAFGPLSPNTDLNLAMRLDAPNLSTFAPFAGSQLPELGPLKADATLTGKDGDYSLSDLLITLNDGETSASVKGAIEKLNGLEDIALALQADTETLSRLLQQSGVEMPYPLPQVVHAKARLTGSVAMLAIEDLSAQFEGDGLQAELTGSATNIVDLEGISADVTLQVDSLDRLSSFAGRPLPPIGPLESSARIVPGTSGFALETFSANLNDDSTNAALSGTIADLKNLAGIDIELQANTSELSALLEGAAVELPYPLPKTVEASARISGSLEQLAIESLVAEVMNDGVKITAAGNVQNVRKLDGIDLDATLEADSLALFSPYAHTELPGLGPLTAAAKLTGNQGVLALPSLEAKLDAKQLQASAKGTMGNLLEVDDIELDITADSNALAEILQELKIESPVPLPGNVQATTKLAGNLEKLSLIDLRASAADPGLSATVTGTVENLLRQEGIAADIVLSAEQLSSLSKYAGTELPDLGPLEASAQVSSAGETLEVNAIKAALADQGIAVNLSGSIADVLNLEGLEASANLDVDSLSTLNTALGSMLEQDLPATTPLKAEARLSATGGIDSAVIDLNASGAGIHADISGSLPSTTADDLDQVKFNFAVDTLDRLGELIGAKDMTGPQGLEVSGTLSTGKGLVNVSDFNTRLGDASATGSLEIDLPQNTKTGRPKIYGDIVFDEVNLADLMPDIFDKSWSVQPTVEEDTVDVNESHKKEKIPKEEAEEETKKGPLFSSKPLPNAFLKKLDIDLGITAKALEARELLLEDFEAILTLQNGVLFLHPLTARVGEGAFDGRIIVDSRAQPAFRKVDFYMEHATFKNFGGTVEIVVDLEGAGNTAAEFMAGLNGDARLLVRGAEIKKSAMTEFGSGLLESINPFSKESDTTDLVCAIVHLDIDDGFVDAKNKIAAQTNEVTWFGNATIDLKTEELTVKIHPKPRRGAGISTGGLAKLVYVGGTLSQPKLQLDPKDFALKYGKYAAAISTGGITLLVDLLLSKAQANADVCDNIIKKIEKKERKERKKLERKQRGKQKSGDPAPAQPVSTKTAEDRALEHLLQEAEGVQTPAESPDEAEAGGEAAKLPLVEGQSTPKDSPQKTWANPFLRP